MNARVLSQQIEIREIMIVSSWRQLSPLLENSVEPWYIEDIPHPLWVIIWPLDISRFVSFYQALLGGGGVLNAHQYSEIYEFQSLYSCGIFVSCTSHSQGLEAFLPLSTLRAAAAAADSDAKYPDSASQFVAAHSPLLNLSPGKRRKTAHWKITRSFFQTNLSTIQCQCNTHIWLVEYWACSIFILI